jgi:hypothetical protein
MRAAHAGTSKRGHPRSIEGLTAPLTGDRIATGTSIDSLRRSVMTALGSNCSMGSANIICSQPRPNPSITKKTRQRSLSLRFQNVRSISTGMCHHLSPCSPSIGGRGGPNCGIGALSFDSRRASAIARSGPTAPKYCQIGMGGPYHGADGPWSVSTRRVGCFDQHPRHRREAGGSSSRSWRSSLDSLGALERIGRTVARRGKRRAREPPPPQKSSAPCGIDGVAAGFSSFGFSATIASSSPSSRPRSPPRRGSRPRRPPAWRAAPGASRGRSPRSSPRPAPGSA